MQMQLKNSEVQQQKKRLKDNDLKTYSKVLDSATVQSIIPENVEELAIKFVQSS